MQGRVRSLVALVVVLTLVAAGGCSKKKDAKRSGSSGTTASTAAPAPDAGPQVPAPLTGTNMAQARAEQALLIVKVDNGPGLRQHGLAEADVVFEEMVEGGVTRFAALYHSTEAPVVGPVRSVRSTDMNLATSFNRPLFAYSGANALMKVLLRRAVFIDVGFESKPAAYTRREDYPAPSNLFTSTEALRQAAQFPGTAPAAMWAFQADGAAPGGAAAGEASLVFPGRSATKVRWVWDANSRTWLREQAGAAHLDGAGKQLSAANVIVHFVAYKDSRIRDRSQAPVPEANLVGSGEAWFLIDGKLVKGKWDKPSLSKPTTYVDGAGKAIELRPGRTWVELAPPGSANAR